jgi:hypothetical protein
MIVENEEDQNKPKFLLYTGTEEAEEKNIYVIYLIVVGTLFLSQLLMN